MEPFTTAMGDWVSLSGTALGGGEFKLHSSSTIVDSQRGDTSVRHKCDASTSDVNSKTRIRNHHIRSRTRARSEGHACVWKEDKELNKAGTSQEEDRVQLLDMKGLRQEEGGTIWHVTPEREQSVTDCAQTLALN